MISYEYEERTWISSLCPTKHVYKDVASSSSSSMCMVPKSPNFCDVVTSPCIYIYIRVCKDARSFSTRKTRGRVSCQFYTKRRKHRHQPTKETRQTHMPCRAPAWRHSEAVGKVGTPHATERTTGAGDCTGHAIYFFFLSPFSPSRDETDPVQARPAHTTAPNRPAGACGPLGRPSEVAAACTADHNGR